MTKMLMRPAHPERVCWGCDRYCSADDLGCANGTIRTPHPCELFGGDWWEWVRVRSEPDNAAADQATAAPNVSAIVPTRSIEPSR